MYIVTHFGYTFIIIFHITQKCKKIMKKILMYSEILTNSFKMEPTLGGRKLSGTRKFFRQGRTK